MLFERATCHILLFKKGATASQEEGGPGFGRRERNVFLRKRAFRFGFEWFICFLHRVSCKKIGCFRRKIVFFPGELRRFCFYKKYGPDRGGGGRAGVIPHFLKRGEPWWPSGGYSFFFRNEGSARADGRGVFPLAMARSFLVITRYLKESEGLVERRGSWSMGNFSLRLSL